MKIGITGANGFVGANLLRQLADQPYSVRVLQYQDHQALDGLNIEIVKGELGNLASLDKFCEGLEVVFHLAGKISIGNVSQKEVFDVNVHGTKNLVEACKQAGIKRYIHFSSVDALDRKHSDGILNEKSALAINSKIPYESTKAIAEEWVLDQQSDGFDVIVLNPSALVGPFDFKPSLLGQFFIQVMEGRLPALVPGGYNWVDVRDVCNAAIQAISKGNCGERYVLSGTWKSVADFVQMIDKETGKQSKILTVPFWMAGLGVPPVWLWSKITGQRPLYTKSSLEILKTSPRQVDNTKAKTDLGFNPRPLEVTVRDTVKWLIDNKYIKK